MRKDEAKMQFERVLKLRCLSPNTVTMYMYYAKLFLDFAGKDDVCDCNLSDAQSFVVHLIDDLHYKPLSTNVVIGAVRYFYESVLSIVFSRRQFPYLVYPGFDPFIFSPDQIRRMLSTSDVRVRLIILLGVDCGLRVSEVAELRISDIDSKKMLIHIRCSKRNKSRNVKLSSACLKALREFWINYKPADFFFPGRRGNPHISADTVRDWFNRYVSGFDFYNERITFHCLRHTFATNMLDNGCDILLLKELMGHSSLSSTARYIHLTTRAIENSFSLSDVWEIQ